MIRVLIAEGSPFQANFLSLALKQSGVAESVGVARNGEEAIVLAHRLKPDVILMDAGLPVLRAALATRQIMEHAPSRILITTQPSSDEEDLAFVALDEGAIDLVKRASPETKEGVTRILVKRIELAARSCLAMGARARPAPVADTQSAQVSAILRCSSVVRWEVFRQPPRSFAAYPSRLPDRLASCSIWRPAS